MLQAFLLSPLSDLSKKLFTRAHKAEFSWFHASKTWTKPSFVKIFSSWHTFGVWNITSTFRKMSHLRFLREVARKFIKRDWLKRTFETWWKSWSSLTLSKRRYSSAAETGSLNQSSRLSRRVATQKLLKFSRHGCSSIAETTCDIALVFLRQNVVVFYKFKKKEV